MAADPACVAAARQVLAQLGVTVTDLQEDSQGSRVPTVAEYLPRVLAAAGPGARRTYGSYWARMAAIWGTRQLDEIAASDIEALQRETVACARWRRTARGGRHAGEHVIAAARAIYNRAIADGLLDAKASPAHRVPKPRRLPSTRRALTPDELERIKGKLETSLLYKSFCGAEEILMNSLRVSCIAEKALLFLFTEQNLLPNELFLRLVKDLGMDLDYLSRRLSDCRRASVLQRL